jgi:hypothetical protein
MNQFIDFLKNKATPEPYAHLLSIISGYGK